MWLNQNDFFEMNFVHIIHINFSAESQSTHLIWIENDLIKFALAKNSVSW